MESASFRLHECPELGERFYEAHHPSGLRILVCPKDMSVTYAALGVPCGSFDRTRGEPAGVAHFLEHKMFETVRGGDAEKTFAALGAEVNAYTTYDRTVYLFSCTQSRQGSFDRALAALLRMTAGLHITPESVRREKRIIREEIRMGADDPWEVCANLLLRSLYRTHPIRGDICGTEASVGRITPEILRDTFAARYGRNGMTLAVCGQVTPEQVLAAVDACPGLRRQSARRKTAPPAPRPVREPAAVYRERALQDMRRDAGGSGSGDEPSGAGLSGCKPSGCKPVFSLGVKDADIPTDPQGMLRRDLCMCILSEMLFSCSEDFYNDLYESGLVTPGVSYGTSIGRGYAFYDFMGESDDPEAVYAGFLARVECLTREGLPRDAFERSRRIQYADYVTGFDSAEGIGGSLLSYAMDGLSLYDFLPTAASVTFEEVEALFRRTFRPGQYALAVVYPPET